MLLRQLYEEEDSKTSGNSDDGDDDDDDDDDDNDGVAVFLSTSRPCGLFLVAANIPQIVLFTSDPRRLSKRRRWGLRKTCKKIHPRSKDTARVAQRLYPRKARRASRFARETTHRLKQVPDPARLT